MDDDVGEPSILQNEVKEYSGFCASVGSSTDFLTYQQLGVLVLLLLLLGHFNSSFSYFGFV